MNENKYRSGLMSLIHEELSGKIIGADKIIVAPSKATEVRRTFQSAATVLHALRKINIEPKTLNVFTYGPHARRSRLVFAKVFRPGTSVGVIAWDPPEYGSVPWWRSSQRAKELLSESAGYVFELLLNSGRLTNHSTSN